MATTSTIDTHAVVPPPDPAGVITNQAVGWRVERPDDAITMNAQRRFWKFGPDH
jgi:hypothetical protein